MLRVLFVLLGSMCVSMNISAVTNQELIQNLSSRMQKLPKADGALIKSFTNHSQSYVYDQALAIIAFSKANEKNKARELLLGLRSLQMKDGSLYFSYYLDGKSPYPIEGDKRFAGAIAWVAMAATHYQNEFKSKEFVSFNSKILSYLHSQMASIEVNGTKTKALRFAPSDIKVSSWNEFETAALEHNLDAYAAFQFFEKLNASKIYQKDIKHLETFVMNMWDQSRGHFWSGANIKTGAINQSELYLDNQSWSLLALSEEHLKKIKPKDAMELNCEVFFVKHEGIHGFMDSKPTRRPASSQFVWSEGSLGQILAMEKLEKIHKEPLKCNDRGSAELLKSIHFMKKEDNGIAYSTSTPNPDFTTASSVAGTAWLYFAANSFNPFELHKVLK